MADGRNRNRSYAYEEFKLKREITNIFNTAREMLDAADHILQVPLSSSARVMEFTPDDNAHGT